MEEAINFLPGFIKRYNDKFSVVPLDPNPAYRPCKDTKVLDLILCKKAERKILNGSTFSYLGKTYQLIDESNILLLKHGIKIIIHILPGGELLGKYNGKYYKMEEFRKPEPVSKQAMKIEAKGPRESYRPGPDHPWRKFTIR